MPRRPACPSPQPQHDSDNGHDASENSIPSPNKSASHASLQQDREELQESDFPLVFYDLFGGDRALACRFFGEDIPLFQPKLSADATARLKTFISYLPQWELKHLGEGKTLGPFIGWFSNAAYLAQLQKSFLQSSAMVAAFYDEVSFAELCQRVEANIASRGKKMQLGNKQTAMDGQQPHGNGAAYAAHNGNGVIPMPPQFGVLGGVYPAGHVLTHEELVERQLQADVEAYAADRAFCTALLASDENGVQPLGPAEKRNIQLRLFDLGHMMRTANHRIELGQYSRQTLARRNGNGQAGFANPDIVYGVHGNNGVPGILDGHPAYGASAPAQFGSHTYGQERRRPGRPPGSKNRPRDPSESAASGTKHALSSELRLGTPNGEDYSIVPDGGSPDHPNKRSRQLHNPFKAMNRSHNDLTTVADDGASDITMDDHGVIVGESSNPAAARSTASFPRRGHWQCTLCTSPKYLHTSTPRQPAEPSGALRDVSKMVTHCVRMHTEHTDAERCVALGHALDANRDQLKYWLTTTKKEKNVSDDYIETAVRQLLAGSMPLMLRRVNNDAANFSSN